MIDCMRKTFRFPVALLIGVVVLLPVQRSWAWIDTGHKIIALIAWEDLTPNTKAAVTDLLKQHPRYEKDLTLDLPADATPDEAARHTFLVAATWPDIVRGRGHPMNPAYNHPQWHYIDIPFEDGAQAPAASESNPSQPGNVVEALLHCIAELKDRATSDDQKAIDLCWIEHLLGDIHQPLHAATHYSPQFPKGDAGGNSAIVLRDPPYPDSRENLHLVWDSLPGDFKSEFIDQYIANGLRGDPSYSRERLKSFLNTTDFAVWARQSHALAVEYAYLNGKLEVASGRTGAPTTQPIPGLPPGYLKQAERVAMQQVALSGYRLADLLNSVFDPKP
jgi:hypothetical protein